MRGLMFAAVMTATGAAQADRLAPWATQQAALGCWEVGAGATLTLTRVGKHSVRARARFRQRPRGGPAVIDQPGTWVAASEAYRVPCRPRSQHGGFCMVRPAADGVALDVEVYAHPHGDPSAAKLVETLVASRCMPKPKTQPAPKRPGG